MSKTVAFKVPAPKLAATAEKWVTGRDSVDPGEGAQAATPAPEPIKAQKPVKEKMARFTLDVTEDLHRRIKIDCAMRGQPISEIMREVLEREFPVKP